MAATDVEICNLALDHLGITEKITNLTNMDKVTQACARWYAQARDNLLARFPWRFATKTAVLAAATAPTVDVEFAYAYEVPADMVAVQRLYAYGASDTPRPDQLERWTTEDVGGTPYLLSDLAAQEDADDVVVGPLLRYTFKNTTVTQYPPHFVELLAIELAMRLVTPLRVDPNTARTLLPMRQLIGMEAAVAERQGEVQRPYDFDADYIRARS